MITGFGFQQTKDYQYIIGVNITTMKNNIYLIFDIIYKLKLKEKYQNIQKLTRESFIEATSKNIVLIEAY